MTKTNRQSRPTVSPEYVDDHHVVIVGFDLVEQLEENSWEVQLQLFTQQLTVHRVARSLWINVQTEIGRDVTRPRRFMLGNPCP